MEPLERLAFPLNFAGRPATSVPAGFTGDGLPVGMRVVGEHPDDPLVPRASAAFEAASSRKDRWPPLLDESRV